MKAWRAVMEEWEQSAKQIKSNAEILESVCQEKLAQLYQDKRKTRKAYHEEHNKIATQFTNVSYINGNMNIVYYLFIYIPIRVELAQNIIIILCGACVVYVVRSWSIAERQSPYRQIVRMRFLL